jgi:hypothetical protein
MSFYIKYYQMNKQPATVAQVNAIAEAIANTVTIAHFNAALAKTATYA